MLEPESRPNLTQLTCLLKYAHCVPVVRSATAADRPPMPPPTIATRSIAINPFHCDYDLHVMQPGESPALLAPVASAVASTASSVAAAVRRSIPGVHPSVVPGGRNPCPRRQGRERDGPLYRVTDVADRGPAPSPTTTPQVSSRAPPHHPGDDDRSSSALQVKINESIRCPSMRRCT